MLKLYLTALRPFSPGVDPSAVPIIAPTELHRLLAASARDVFMSKAPNHNPSPLPVTSNLHLQDAYSDDLLLTSVLKRKGLICASSKTFKKSNKNHRCNSALLDNNHNIDSLTTIPEDVVRQT